MGQRRGHAGGEAEGGVGRTVGILPKLVAKCPSGRICLAAVTEFPHTPRMKRRLFNRLHPLTLGLVLLLTAVLGWFNLEQQEIIDSVGPNYVTTSSWECGFPFPFMTWRMSTPSGIARFRPLVLACDLGIAVLLIAATTNCCQRLFKNVPRQMGLRTLFLTTTLAAINIAILREALWEIATEIGPLLVLWLGVNCAAFVLLQWLVLVPVRRTATWWRERIAGKRLEPERIP